MKKIVTGICELCGQPFEKRTPRQRCCCRQHYQKLYRMECYGGLEEFQYRIYAEIPTELPCGNNEGLCCNEPGTGCDRCGWNPKVEQKRAEQRKEGATK